MGEPSGMQRLDTLINELVEADQTASEIDPMDVARELGEIKAQLLAMPTVHRGAEDLRHFRCETCGTITHGDSLPARCTHCGGKSFVNVDIEG